MLLATKLHVPLRQHDLVIRPRLLDKLQAGLRSRLILLSSPPGFGKTTLLTQWIAAASSRPDAGATAAWLALDDGDNDPTRFFAYLSAAVAALCAAQAHAPALPPGAAAASPEQRMTGLINALTASPGHKLLVLDDYHVIHAPALHQAVTFLIEHMPATLHLVLCTRADPPLPLARWRARRELTELREADLRFRGDEAREFLTTIMGVSVTDTEIQMLEQRTEGWIAGLQLAALSLQDVDDVPRQVQRFARANAFIGDYLAEEVLQQQPPDVQQFLLDTAFLPRLCGDLCAAVTGQADSAARLAALERGHLFLIALDDERVWYRYHHFFGEMLRSRSHHAAQTGGRDHLYERHRRAAAWYAAYGSSGEAIDQALAADALAPGTLAADLLEAHYPQFQRRGEYVTLAGWLQRLPAPVYAARPRLCQLRAKTHMFLHQLDAAEAWLARTYQVLAAAPDLDPDQAIRSATMIVQCDLALNRNELSRAIDLAQRTLAILPPERVRQRGEVLMLLGVAHFWRGEFLRAEATCREASAAAAAAGDTLLTVYARGNAGRACYHQGRLHAAAAALHAVLDETTARGEGELPVYAGTLVALGKVYGEWDQLATAHGYVTAGMARARQAGNPRTLLQGYSHTLRIVLGMGRTAEVAELIEEANVLLRDVRLPPRMVEAFTYAAVRAALATGDTATVDAWLAHGPDPVAAPAPGAEPLHLLLVRVWAARGRYADALGLLQQLQRRLDAQQQGRLFLETQICEAALLAATAGAQEAAASLRSVLPRAAAEGYVRLFVEEGAPMRDLLTALLPQLEEPALAAYVHRLLQAFPTPIPQPDAPGCATGAGSALDRAAALPVEPLSARELEVLRLVDRGLSDRAVAAELVVVTGTVKRHLSNIYAKLGVNSRTQALARARTLGWLDPPA
jgi:LuxR family maltose regulon positive regulatory protein